MKWHEPAIPRSVVQMVPVDLEGRLLVMHRSDKVRSAKNVWSFPSGLHDIGETQEQSVARELLEEYDLKLRRAAICAVYENIAGDEDGQPQYHWVVSLFVALVDDVTAAVNKEPDKHDKMGVVPYTALALDKFWEEHQFHKSFHDAMIEGRHRVALTAQALIMGEGACVP